MVETMPTMCSLRSNFLYTLRPVLLAAFLTVCSVLAHATVVHDSIVSVDAFILQFNDTVATRKHCVFSCVGAMRSLNFGTLPSYYVETVLPEYAPYMLTA